MKKILVISSVVIAISLISFFVVKTIREAAKTREYASAFPSKTWYYSLDGGKTWQDRAESGLKGFDEDGIPIHLSDAWNQAEWQDENTILWTATNGNESIWKAFDSPPF
ncbi:MAG: hypothetical protein K2U26_14190 [Cyclobacteriaceae bacterium]|nr:hypothetical protein [Cyclobacteriaceae bacterium]